MSAHVALRRWVKARQNPVACLIHDGLKNWSYCSVRPFRRMYQLLFQLRGAALQVAGDLRRVLWDTPLFRSQLNDPPREMMIYGGIPQILGPVIITIGERCRISAQTTISGRAASASTPRLVMGRNCDVGWQTTIAVGTDVLIGNNVRIAGRAFLAGYPGHPLDARARAEGSPDLASQCGAIVIEDDVWLATNVTVSAGVTIGKGTIVASGSVVTKDLPPFVLAAGVPAKPVRSLDNKSEYADA